MAGNALYDVGMRLRAAELHDEGHGRAAIAALLGIPEETVREWLCTYRSAGIEVLAMMGKKHTAYSFETKLAAVRAVVDEGMTKPEAMEKFGIASPSPFKKWLKAYREEGPEALRPKPRGRPRGSGSPSGETTREQELERRIKRLEAENAYLKKSIALMLASIYFSPFSPTYFRQSRQRGCAGSANADAPLSASRLPPPSRPRRRWIRPSGGTTVPLS